MGSQEKYAEVVVDIPVQEVDHPFQYLIPPPLIPKIKIGSAVLIPFHYTRRIGYVTSISPKKEVPKVSPLLDLLEEASFFSPEMVKLCRHVADYYLSTLGEALRLAFPPGRGRRLYQEITLVPSSEFRVPSSGKKLSEGAKVLLKRLEEAGGSLSLKELLKSWGKRLFFLLKELERENLIEKKYRLSSPQVNILEEEYAKLNLSNEEILKVLPTLTLKAPKQERMLEILLEAKEIPLHELLALSGAASSSFKALQNKGLVKTFPKPTFREPDFSYTEPPFIPLSLTKEQIEAVKIIKKALHKKKSETFLLQGVTGSGKTEVYLRAIAEALKLGKTAIVLVPEIALTPQTVSRFRSRFGEIVAVFHSGLSLGERYDQWRRVKDGFYKVVVGARSALFSPLANLGLIVIDEEHETTYKQERNPRYNAREVAFKRAKLNQAVVILGSATPALETKARAENQEFKPLSLTKRIGGRKLPQIKLVDMREENRRGNKSLFSLELQNALKAVMSSQEKAILFLNRRGFSSFLLCRDCGLVIKCKRCAVSLVYHQDKKVLKCHHCHYVRPAPMVCPTCQSYHLGYFGVGTQRVEKELQTIFPQVPIIRMDADTTTRRGAHRRKLDQFIRQKSGILLGTQMIAKGLDFPEVTLVGVINADTALNLPDFRAAERTFQLLMQVSGRAGRGPLPGHVIIQTYLPESYAIQAVLNQDYDSFYRKEIQFRAELNYPPFCRLVNLGFAGRKEEEVTKIATEVSQGLTKILPPEVSLLGPAPAPFPKIRNRYRWHLLLKVGDGSGVQEILRGALKEILEKIRLSSTEVSITIDVDPISLL